MATGELLGEPRELPGVLLNLVLTIPDSGNLGLVPGHPKDA